MTVTVSKRVNVLYFLETEIQNPNDLIQIPLQKLVHFPIEKLWFFSIITRHGGDICKICVRVSLGSPNLSLQSTCVSPCVFVISKHSCQLAQKKRRLIVQKSSRKSTGFHGIPESGTTQSQQVFANIVFEWACSRVHSREGASESLYVPKLFIANSISKEFSHGLNIYLWFIENCNAGWYVCSNSFDSLFKSYILYIHNPYIYTIINETMRH